VCLLGRRVVQVHFGLGRRGFKFGVCGLGAGIGLGAVLCFGSLTLRLLASLLLDHSLPQILNLVNGRVALAEKGAPLLLGGFGCLGERIHDQNRSNKNSEDKSPLLSV
jgi:hypothetical protein